MLIGVICADDIHEKRRQISHFLPSCIFLNYYFVYVFHLIKFVCLFFSFFVATGFPGE